MLRTKTKSKARSGYSLIEIMVAVALFAVVLLTSTALVESGRKFSASTVEITAVEDLAQRMLFRLENELANATGDEPESTVQVDLGPNDVAQLQVLSTAGFPPQGILLMQRGTAWEERIAYSGLLADQSTFTGLVRGSQCSAPVPHLDGANLQWAGLAMPLETQVAPPASEYDGIALEDGTEVYFRGDGTGFSYRVPVDPAGNGYFLNGDDLNWGAELIGAGATLDGHMALYFEPKTTFNEADDGQDVNGDGDSVDVFDLGQIRRITWDKTNPGGVINDVGMGPSSVLQERCNWGGDLDNDQYSDPIFLWDPETNILHVRLFILGVANKEIPIVRKVESVMFLRNEPEIN